MITLKNGHIVKYDKDFDKFFKSLLEAIVKESRKEALYNSPDSDDKKKFNELFLKELMDNCIYITHQLFEISKKNEEFSKFIISGFIFNSTVLSLPTEFDDLIKTEEDNKEIIH